MKALKKIKWWKLLLFCLAAVGVLLVSQIVGELIGSLPILLGLPEGIGNLIAGAVYAGLALLGILLCAVKWMGIEPCAIGLYARAPKPLWIIAAVLLPAAVKGVFLLMPGDFVSSGLDGAQTFTALSAGIAFTGLAAGFVEELVFRSVIMHVLKEKWGTWAAVLIPSVLFGAVHLIGVSFDPLSCLLVLAAGTAVGVMFSFIALAGGSIVDSAIVHAVWNIIIIGGGLAVSTQADPYSCMTYVLRGDSVLLTGGQFGIESSAAAVIGYAVVASAAGLIYLKTQTHAPAGTSSED